MCQRCMSNNTLLLLGHLDPARHVEGRGNMKVVMNYYLTPNLPFSFYLRLVQM